MPQWVAEEYENTLSFIFLAIAAVLPWGVSNAYAGTRQILRIRWAIGEINYVPSVPDVSGWESLEHVLMRPHGGDPLIELASGFTVYPAFVAWALGSLLTLAAVALAVALLIDEDMVSTSINVPFTAGVLLIGMSGAYITSLVLLYRYSIPGVYIPVGAGFQLLFGAVLLTNENRVADPGETVDSEKTDSDAMDTTSTK